MVEYPLMIFALIPVILIETWIVVRSLKQSTFTSAKVVTIANLVSTLLGFPLAWGIMWGISIAVTSGIGEEALGMDTFPKKLFAVTVEAPWLIPYEHDLYWMIPTAAIILLVPAYFVSVWSEGLIMRAMLPKETKSAVFPAVWKANLASYGFLLLLGVAWLAHSIYSH